MADVLVTPPPTTTVDGWKPNPGPQEFSLMQPASVFEILYGGARGGGKTDAGLAWMTEYMRHPRFRGLVLRRNVDDLSDWIDRAEFMYKPYGVKVSRHPQAVIHFPAGGKIRVGHMKDKNAYTKYQGHEYQKILIEELTQIPKEAHYQNILSSARSTVAELRPQVFLTTNPGGVGHGWVKRRFIKPKVGEARRPNWPFLSNNTKRDAIFIPASVDDNPVLMEKDPYYVNILEGYKETDEQLYRAWRFGSWDVFVGQAFGEFDYNTHTTQLLPYPLKDCYKIMAFDWGYSANGVMVWLAVTPENRWGVRRIYVYRELVQNKKSPEEWGVELNKINKQDVERGWGSVQYMSLPHDCYSKVRSEETIAKTFEKLTGLSSIMMPTQSAGARVRRKALLHTMFGIGEDKIPRLLIQRHCTYLIETIPELVYDDTNVEDINTDGEDHGYDALTGGLLQLSVDTVSSGAVSAKENKQDINYVPSIRSSQSGVYKPPDLMGAVAKKQKKRKSPY